METTTITSQHLEAARDLVQSARKQLDADSVAVSEAVDKRQASQTRVNRFSHGFDQLVAGFSNGQGVGDDSAQALPPEIQSIIGYAPKKAAPPPEEKDEAPAPAP
jgi:hypothetical protein